MKKSKTVSFTSSIIKNVIAPLSRSRFPIKLICLLLLDLHQVLVVYVNLLLSFYNIFKNNYSLQTTSCIIISLTCCNFVNVMIFSHITINWLSKIVFFHQSLRCNFLFMLLEDSIMCILFYCPHFQTIKQKVCFLYENLEKSRN